MKIVSYGLRGAEQPGVLVGDEVVPLAPALADAGLAGLPPNALFALWPALAELVRHAVAHGRTRLPLLPLRLGPPVPHPGKIVGVGLNYFGKVADTSALPAEPVLFLKPPAAIAGPFDAVLKPLETRDMEPELEIVVVIGKAGRRVPAEQALDHVLGYMIGNDITARDVFIGESQRSALFLQAARGKGFPGFCPTGPWLLTRDEVPDLAALDLLLTVNGEVRQAGRSDSMICCIPQLVAAASRAFGLMPGDVLLSGSPPRRKRADGGPTALMAGDEMRGSISLLGEMRTPVADETPLQ